MNLGCILSFRDNYTLFRHNYIIEFDKNANSIYVIVVTPISRKVSLATIGVCVFCAVASVAALFILYQSLGGKKNEKTVNSHSDIIPLE